MKKTLLALTVTSLFSAGAMAAANPFKYDNVHELKKVAEEAGATFRELHQGKSTLIVDKEGNELVVQNIGKGEYLVVNNDKSGEETGRDIIEVDSSGDIVKRNGEDARIDNENWEPTPLPPISDSEQIQDNRNNIEDNKQEIEKNSRHNADQDKQIGSNTNRIASNEKKIAGLEESMKKMGNKMLQLEERMDGVVATSHAVTNARPVLSAVGEYGMGVGIGAAGSKQALAFGGAMQMTENWSASTTVNYETKGKHSKGQFSAGVGAQYKF